MKKKSGFVDSGFVKTCDELTIESVYAIANENNIWGNIQLSDKPNRIRWDFAQANDWMPLFSGNITNPGLPSVQPNELVVTAPDQRAAKQLKERIERSLRDTLMNLRKTMNQRYSIYIKTVSSLSVVN